MVSLLCLQCLRCQWSLDTVKIQTPFSQLQHGGHASQECLEPDDGGKIYKDLAIPSVPHQDMLYPCICEKRQDCFQGVFLEIVDLHFMRCAVEYIRTKNDDCVYETRGF